MFSHMQPTGSAGSAARLPTRPGKSTNLLSTATLRANTGEKCLRFLAARKTATTRARPMGQALAGAKGRPPPLPLPMPRISWSRQGPAIRLRRKRPEISGAKPLLPCPRKIVRLCRPRVEMRSPMTPPRSALPWRKSRSSPKTSTRSTAGGAGTRRKAMSQRRRTCGSGRRRSCARRYSSRRSWTLDSSSTPAATERLSGACFPAR